MFVLPLNSVPKAPLGVGNRPKTSHGLGTSLVNHSFRQPHHIAGPTDDCDNGPTTRGPKTRSDGQTCALCS